MSDWEDDDFGGFESADIADAETAQTTVVSPGPSSATDLSKEGSSTQILDWILSNTPKADASGLQPEQRTGSGSDLPSLSIDVETEKTQEPSLDSPASLSHGEQLKERLNDSAELAKSLDDIYTSSTGSLNVDSNQSKSNWSTDFNETQAKIRHTVIEEPPKTETVDNEALHKLQAELDAALLMKDQTESYMAKVQRELEELTERRKQDLEESAKKHEEELDKLKSQHKDEMKELQRISEETVELVTKQYADIWKIFEKEKAIEAETTANSIMEKCLELMKQQQETLSTKLEENRLEQEKSLKQTLRNEREDLETEIEKKLEEGKNNLEQELTVRIQEKMSEEAKKLQEIHSQSLKDAMAMQQAHFEETLRSTLSREREKFAETLKDAVKKAQVTTEKAADERKRVEENRVRNHTVSVKMFLTSALKQLEQHFPNDEELQQTQSKES